MIVTLERLVNAQPALNWLSEISDLDHLSATVKYDLSLLLGAISPHMQAYEVARIAAVKTYGEKGEEGLKVPPKNMAAFGEVIQELMRTTECELPDTTIPAAPLIEIITPAQLLQLDWLLKKDPPASKKKGHGK